MGRLSLGAAASLAFFATPALAQTLLPLEVPAGRVKPTVANPGGPGIENSGPGATGSIRTGPTGSDTVSNNPAGAGNAQMPSRAVSTPSGNGCGP